MLIFHSYVSLPKGMLLLMHWCRAVKVMVKGLRLAFEEGEEAGCDRDVIDNCCGLSLFSWSCTVEICWNMLKSLCGFNLQVGLRSTCLFRTANLHSGWEPNPADCQPFKEKNEKTMRKAENRSSTVHSVHSSEVKATLHRLAVEQAVSHDLWR